MIKNDDYWEMRKHQKHLNPILDYPMRITVYGNVTITI